MFVFVESDVCNFPFSFVHSVEFWSWFRMTVFVLPVVLAVMGVCVHYTHTDDCSTLTVSHESLLVEYRHPVELTCSIPSKPSPEFFLGWEAQINPVQTSSETSLVWRTSSLTEWEMNGREMFCYLTVPSKKQCKKKVQLNLYKRPDSVKISSESRVWSEGQMRQLKCKIENVGPLQNLTVQWIRVDQNKNRTVTEMLYGNFIALGEKRKSGNVTSTLNVSANRDEDGVQYQCAALLKLEQLQQSQVGSSEPLNITVHYKPTIIQPSSGTISVTKGDELLLNCSAHGNPSPQYSWNSPGNMNLTASSILISSVQSEDQGQYSCTAYNDEGFDSVTVTVNVVDKPTIIQPSSGTISVTKGAELLLNCSAHGNPSPQYSWSSPGNKNLTASSILISSVQSEDQGQYSCTAYNDEGFDSVTVTVNVVDKPTIIQPSSGTISVTKGDKLVLNCSAHGNPSPQYSWSSPGNKNLTTSSIFISSVQSEDQGQYICTAYNDEGSDSVTVMVNVVVDYKMMIIIIAVSTVVGVVLVIGFRFYRHTQNNWRNLASHRHNGNVALSNDMGQSQLWAAKTWSGGREYRALHVASGCLKPSTRTVFSSHCDKRQLSKALKGAATLKHLQQVAARAGPGIPHAWLPLIASAATPQPDRATAIKDLLKVQSVPSRGRSSRLKLFVDSKSGQYRMERAGGLMVILVFSVFVHMARSDLCAGRKPLVGKPKDDLVSCSVPAQEKICIIGCRFVLKNGMSCYLKYEDGTECEEPLGISKYQL
ncbi:hypothetical protein AOLI_G00233290 [Acnodon oligacanthus]